MEGVGLCFSRLFPGPILRDRVLALFSECRNPSVEAVARLADALARSHLDTHDLHMVHECASSSASGSGSTLTVQLHHLDNLAHHLRFETTTACRVTLKDLGCGSGVVTDRSSPDGYAYKPFRRLGPQGELLKLVTLVAEVKHTTTAPVESLRQAAAEATNVALAQARAGVPVGRIRVPVWSSNGQLMKFGVMRMLESTFPYFEVLTKTLDIGDKSDRHDAAWVLQVLSEWCLQEEAFEGAPHPELVFGLSRDRYFLKPLQAVKSVYTDSELGLQHMFDVLARFHNTSAQACVALPITIMTRVDGMHGGYLVFPHLSRQGYRLGMPTEKSQRLALVEAIRQAVRRIHEAGVVHVDLYFSNMMWRCDDEGHVMVMIIDWDAVHAVGEPLLDSIRDCLSPDRILLLGMDKAPLLATPELDLVFLDVLFKHCHAEKLQVDDKGKLDLAFRNLVIDESNLLQAARKARSSLAESESSIVLPHIINTQPDGACAVSPEVEAARRDLASMRINP
jgi:hypothetical protein